MHAEGSFIWPGCNSDRVLATYNGANDTKTSGGEVTGIWHCSAADTDRERGEEIQHAGGIQPTELLTMMLVFILMSL